jgi:hypothetical protein
MVILYLFQYNLGLNCLKKNTKNHLTKVERCGIIKNSTRARAAELYHTFFLLSSKKLKKIKNLCISAQA